MQFEVVPFPYEGRYLNWGKGGNWSVAGFDLKLTRLKGAYILQIFMPSGMFILISWISFVIPPENGERAGLAVTLLLVIVSMYLAIVNTSPKG